MHSLIKSYEGKFHKQGDAHRDDWHVLSDPKFKVIWESPEKEQPKIYYKQTCYEPLFGGKASRITYGSGKDVLK
jgi:hypothetical protein